jgi:hypothetical protein
MSYQSRHRRFRRMALGLAFASVIYAGSVSAAPNGDDQSGDDAHGTDVYVRPGESQGGPDGGPVVTSNARVSRGARIDTGGQADDQQFRIEHALEAQAQGGLSGYVVEVANGLLRSDEQDGQAAAASQADDQQFRIEHALEAEFQGGLSGYLEDQQVWMDGVSDFPTAAQPGG